MAGADLKTLQPRNILIRAVNWLGDSVMMTPALERLRERFPEAHISLLTGFKLRALWEQYPHLNEVLAFQPGESPWNIGRRLRGYRFDAALVFPNSPRSAIECWWGRIPVRVGYARPWRNLFLTYRVPIPAGYRPMKKRSHGEIRALWRNQSGSTLRADPAFPAESHHTQHYLDLVGALGASSVSTTPRLHVLKDEIASVKAKFGLSSPILAARGQSSNPVVIGLNPGAEYGPAKRWAASSFVEAANLVNRAGDFHWLIFGGSADKAVAAEIASGIQGGAGEASVHDLAGQTSLRELMCLLAACRVLLTNDTGPMHVASALGTRVVVPFGSTSPELTGPGLPGSAAHRLLKADVPCSPCFLRTCPVGLECMRSISPRRAAAAVLELLAFEAGGSANAGS